MILKILSPKKIPGTNVIILKIWRKNWHFLSKILLIVCKNCIIALVLKKNANFFAENVRKSPKIEIMTSSFFIIFASKLFFMAKKLAQNTTDYLFDRQPCATIAVSDQTCLLLHCTRDQTCPNIGGNCFKLLKTI
jgi:hypothetical protein